MRTWRERPRAARGTHAVPFQTCPPSSRHRQLIEFHQFEAAQFFGGFGHRGQESALDTLASRGGITDAQGFGDVAVGDARRTETRSLRVLLGGLHVSVNRPLPPRVKWARFGLCTAALPFVELVVNGPVPRKQGGREAPGRLCGVVLRRQDRPHGPRAGS